MARPTPSIVVSVSPDRIASLVDELAGIRNGVPKAVTAAVNRTLTTGRSIVVKRLAQELALKQKHIREAIALRKATFETLAGAIVLSRKPIPLIEFAPKPAQPVTDYAARMKLRGVSVKVRRGKPRETLKGTFVARMKSGHVGVFERSFKGGSIGGKRVGRLKLAKERTGPTPQGVFERAPGVAADVLGQLGPVLEKNLASQVDRLLQRKKPD